MNQASEFDAGDVSGGAVDTFEIPDCFSSAYEVSEDAEK